MAKKNLVILLLLFSAMFLMASFTQAANHWVAFNGIGHTFTYIMKIDGTGNILTKPKPIFMWDPRFSCGNCPQEPTNELAGDGLSDDSIKGPFIGPRAIALARASATTLHMWQVSSQGSIFHQLINETTLTPVNGPNGMKLNSFVRQRGFESKYTDFRTAKATSDGKLITNTGNIGADDCNNPTIPCDSIVGTITSNTFNADGTLSSKGKRLGRNIPNNKFGSISEDGSILVVNSEVTAGDDTSNGTALDVDAELNIFAQAVAGGTPVVVGNSGAQTASVDISDSASPAVIVYFTRSTDFPDSSNGENLVCQLYDPVTNKKVGPAVNLETNIESPLAHMQAISVLPDGSGVVYLKRPLNSLAPGGGPQSNPDGLQLNNRSGVFFLGINRANCGRVGLPVKLFDADDSVAGDGFRTGVFDENSDPAPGTGNGVEYARPGMAFVSTTPAN